jgi:chorismate mutase
MAQTPKYYIVEAGALPEVYLKVAEAKRMMETGEVSTVNAAARKVGISRSAFYKYRDAIRPFQDMLQGRIVTVQIMLRDEPGVLSAVLNLFAEMGGNILTINQAIPGGGSAAVTIGVETSGLNGSMEDLLEAIGNVKGVIRCHILAG